MSKRWSKNGWFLGCSNYPKCKNTRDLGPDGNGPLAGTPPRETGIACDKCGKPMVIKTGRYGEFLSCTGYPTCKNAQARPARRAVPEVRRRHHRDPPEEARRAPVLRLLELWQRSHQVRLQALAEAHQEPCPLCKAPVPRPRRHEGQADDRVRQQGVRVQAGLPW
jgi:ssDNA-binding Zn-finger/Zn-ribbon topoisomerase 1